MTKRRKPSIELGQTYRDTVTGYQGVVTARSEFLNGCIRYLIETKNAQDGSIHELYFDEERLEHVEAPDRDIKPSNTGGARDGFPRTGSR